MTATQVHGVHGIVGAARSAVSTPVAQLGAVDHMPQLSYWSSSPQLANKAVYPYFGRTYPSDALAGVAMVNSIISYGWRNFAAINTVDAYASAYIVVIRQTILGLPQCSQTALNCTTPNLVATATHNFGDAEGVRAAVRSVKETTVNVVVVIVFDVDFGSLCTCSSALLLYDLLSQV